MTEVTPEVQAAAAQLGVPVESLLGSQPDAAPAEATVVPTETREQELERQLAESQQETQQVRRLAQVASEGRVIGSGGEGMPGAPPVAPDIATIEPGLRYAYQNGLITTEQLTEKVGPLLASLLAKHAGGEVV